MALSNAEFDLLTQALLPQLDHPPLALLAYGSTIEGLATPSSDLDLLAITEERRSLQIIDTDARPIHVEYIPLSTLEESLRDLDWQFRTRLFDFQFTVVRLRHAIPLFDPMGIGQSLVDRICAFQPSDDTLTKFYGQTRSLYHDAVGAYKAGQYQHAILLSRLAAQISTALALLQVGELNIGLKWMHRWAHKRLGDKGIDWWQSYCTALDLPTEDGEEEARRSLRATLTLIKQGGKP